MKTLELHYPLDSRDLSGGERYPPFEQTLPGLFSVTQLCAFGKGTLSRDPSVARSIEGHSLYIYPGNDKLDRGVGVWRGKGVGGGGWGTPNISFSGLCHTEGK